MAPLNETAKKAFILSLFVMLGAASAQAQSDRPAAVAGTGKKVAPAPEKSKINTDIYEKQDYNLNFTDQVKVIRDMEDTTQVLFVKMAGFFTAPSDSTAMAALVESQKNKSTVTISADDTTRKILKVQANKKIEP